MNILRPNIRMRSNEILTQQGDVEVQALVGLDGADQVHRGLGRFESRRGHGDRPPGDGEGETARDGIALGGVAGEFEISGTGEQVRGPAREREVDRSGDAGAEARGGVIEEGVSAP